MTSKTSKKTSTKKGISKKQAAARKKFKEMIVRAKKIKKENPSMKWTSCIKEASKK